MGHSMARDHYVSQVHLKNFESPELGRRFYAIRKSDMKAFAPHSKDVCWLDDGSTNDYLVNPSAIEDFLKLIERFYNRSLDKLRSGQIDEDAIYVIAGFVAYVAGCSPAAMRISSLPLRNMVEASAEFLCETGKIPKLSTPEGDRSLRDMISMGALSMDVDEKYPQALGISNIFRRVGLFGNCEWDVILNRDPQSPFFTSDFPVAIERDLHQQMFNRIVPLAPDVAIRIKRKIDSDRVDDLGFPNFRYRRSEANGASVRDINRLIVRSAEDLVFFKQDASWVKKFVERNRHFRIEPTAEAVRTEQGVVFFHQQSIARRKCN